MKDIIISNASINVNLRKPIVRNDLNTYTQAGVYLQGKGFEIRGLTNGKNLWMGGAFFKKDLTRKQIAELKRDVNEKMARFLRRVA